MRHITKGTEPEAFSQWKEENRELDVVWEDLTSDAKAALRDALLAEQGNICGYCGERLQGNHWPIEHFKPRESYPVLTFDYGNLLASCPGGERDSPPRSLHCDKKKGSWYNQQSLVSPLSPDCDDYFVFLSSGTVEETADSTKSSAARETIARLGLDIAKLNARRKSALEPIREILNSTSEDEKRALIEGYSQPDTEGRLTPFCFALVQVLKRYA